MKKIITLIAIFVLVFINTILSADFWEKLQTPEGGVISRLLIDDSGNIYASWGRNRISTVNYTCRGEIYKSTDQGDNWFILDSNSNHGTIYDLTLLKNEVYIVTVDNNLFHYNSLLNKWIYIQNTSGGFEIRSYENSLYINNGYKIISVKNPNTDSSKTEINYDSHSNSASDFIYHFDINVKGNISVICSNYIMKSIDNF